MHSRVQLGCSRPGLDRCCGVCAVGPEALKAIEDASSVFLAIPELLDAAGLLIARAIDPEARVVEAACVCAGASAGMALMSAAALSKGHPERIDQLPLTVENGIPHEFVVQSSHVVSYEQAWLIPGARVVVAGTHSTDNAIPDGGFAAEDCYCTEAEFEAAIVPGKTAAFLFAA